MDLTKSKEENVTDMLRESVSAILDNAIVNYRHSKRRLQKLKKDFEKMDQQKTAEMAMDQLADMVSVLLIKPQFIHHHSPFVSLNKQLCDHLGKFLPIDKLGVRQSMSKDFKDKLKQMPVLGAAKVFEVIEGSSLAKVIRLILFTS